MTSFETTAQDSVSRKAAKISSSRPWRWGGHGGAVLDGAAKPSAEPPIGPRLPDGSSSGRTNDEPLPGFGGCDGGAGNALPSTASQYVYPRSFPAARPEGSMDQRRLLERASQGDHEAFGMLVGEHFARLDTAARLILRDPELARDAVQEATLRAWRNLRGLRDPDRLGAWLHRLTVNACLDIARKRRGRSFEVELTPLHDAPVPDPTSRIADTLYVERMLAAVDPAQRAVVVLHYYLDLTLPETASALGIPVGTAKSRLNRALDAMRLRVAGEIERPAPATTRERFA